MPLKFRRLRSPSYTGSFRQRPSMLLILFLLHYVDSADVPKYNETSIPPETTTTQQKWEINTLKYGKPLTLLVDKCPDVGYFFKQDVVNSLPTCHLCFCRENNTDPAICWIRENLKCEVQKENYRHQGIGRNLTRHRRFASEMLQNMANSILNLGKSKPKSGGACNPIEDPSHSEGCPPDDWCKGCTVCDCNEETKRWDCHLLKFCLDDQKSKTDKKQEDATKVNRKVQQIIGVPIKAHNTAKKKISAAKGLKHVTKKRTVRPKGKRVSTMAPKKHVLRKKAPASNPKKSIKNNKKAIPPKKLTNEKKNHTKKPIKETKKKSMPKKIMMKKKRVTKKPPPKKHKNAKNHIKTPNYITTPTISEVTETTRQIVVSRHQLNMIAQAVTRKVMTSVEKALGKQIFANPQESKNDLKKRSVKKVTIPKKVHDSKKNKTKSKPLPKNLKKKSSIAVDKSNKVKINRRHKRQVGNMMTTPDKKSTYPNDTQDINQETLKQDIKPAAMEYTDSAKDFANSYYKYTVDNFNRVTASMSSNFTQIIPLDSKNSTTKRSIQNEQATNLNVLQFDFDNKTVLPIIHLNEGNLTLKNWIKVFANHSEVLSKLEYITDNIDPTLVKNNTGLTPKNDTLSVLTLPLKKISTKDVERKIGAVPKKYKLKKIITTLNNRTCRDEKISSVSMTTRSIKNATTSQIPVNPSTTSMKITINKPSAFNSFKNTMHKVFGGRNKTKSRFKNYMHKIIKYLKKFFKTIFFKIKRTNPKNQTNIPELNKMRVIETLCETFGPCNINIKNRARLQRDIGTLNIETFKMLKSIKTIKGLLNLVDFAKNDSDLNETNKVNTKSIFKQDIHKLHAILRGTYGQAEHLDKLTDTERFQLEYIKNNTQHFIRSATRFAIVLNDIVNALTSNNTSTDFASKTNESLMQKKMTSELRSTKLETDTVAKLHPNPFNQIKYLIMKYNMLQNNLMEKIYKLIADFDKIDVKEIDEVVGRTAQNALNATEEDAKYRTQAIRTYTKNIIKNLRNLKNLAQQFTFRGNRKKRNIEDEDTMEYILILMEYLLQQNQHMEYATVNDGIDLIIDVIKQAPDIKPIRKKILEMTTVPAFKLYRKHLKSDAIDVSSLDPITESNSSENIFAIFSKEDKSTSQGEEMISTVKFGSDEEFNNIEDEDETYITKRAQDQFVTINDDTGSERHEEIWPQPKKEQAPLTVFSTRGEITRQVDFDKDGNNAHLKLNSLEKNDAVEEILPSSTISFEIDEILAKTTEQTISSTTNTPMNENESFAMVFSKNQMRYFNDDESLSQNKSRMNWVNKDNYEEVTFDSIRFDSNKIDSDNTIEMERTTQDVRGANINNENNSVLYSSTTNTPMDENESFAMVFSKNQMRYFNDDESLGPNKSRMNWVNKDNNEEVTFGSIRFDSNKTDSDNTIEMERTTQDVRGANINNENNSVLYSSTTNTPMDENESFEMVFSKNQMRYFNDDESLGQNKSRMNWVNKDNNEEVTFGSIRFDSNKTDSDNTIEMERTTQDVRGANINNENNSVIYSSTTNTPVNENESFAMVFSKNQMRYFNDDESLRQSRSTMNWVNENDNKVEFDSNRSDSNKIDTDNTIMVERTTQDVRTANIHNENFISKDTDFVNPQSRSVEKWFHIKEKNFLKSLDYGSVANSVKKESSSSENFTEKYARDEGFDSYFIS